MLLVYNEPFLKIFRLYWWGCWGLMVSMFKNELSLSFLYYHDDATWDELKSGIEPGIRTITCDEILEIRDWWDCITNIARMAVVKVIPGMNR